MHFNSPFLYFGTIVQQLSYQVNFLSRNEPNYFGLASRVRTLNLKVAGLFYYNTPTTKYFFHSGKISKTGENSSIQQIATSYFRFIPILLENICSPHCSLLPLLLISVAAVFPMSKTKFLQWHRKTKFNSRTNCRTHYNTIHRNIAFYPHSSVIIIIPTAGIKYLKSPVDTSRY